MTYLNVHLVLFLVTAFAIVEGVLAFINYIQAQHKKPIKPTGKVTGIVGVVGAALALALFAAHEANVAMEHMGE
jgi:uncharacterized membrane protein HdeD (DUF308 family)